MNSSLSVANLADASCGCAGMVVTGAAIKVTMAAAAVKSLTRVSIQGVLELALRII